MQSRVLGCVSRVGGQAAQGFNGTLQSSVPVNWIIGSVNEDGSEVGTISMLAELEVGARQQVHCKNGFAQAVVVVAVVGPVGDCCLSYCLKLQPSAESR